MIFKRLTAKQVKGWKKLIANKYREILFDGGSRAGKTFLICMYFIVCTMKYLGIRFLIARLAFAHAKSSVWKQTLIPMLSSLFSDLDVKTDNSDFIITNNKTKGEIWLGGLDDKERTDKILGQEYAGIFLNEAVRISRATRDKVKTRLAQRIEGFTNFIIYDCNPRHPLHYLYQEFYIEKNDCKTQLHWLPEDNKENLADGYIEQFLDTLTGNEKERFRLGKWAALPGAVYLNIKGKNVIECDKDFNRYDGIVLGADFGLHNAIVVWGIKDNQAYCLYEIVLIKTLERKATTKDIINELDKIWGVKEYMYPIYCDHEPDRIQELNDAGYNAKKANKEIIAGDGSVNEMELFFDVDCKETFQSMLNLTHQQDSNGNFIDNHVKENDHEADASRYAIHGYKMDNSSTGHVFFKGIM